MFGGFPAAGTGGDYVLRGFRIRRVYIFFSLTDPTANNAVDY